MLILLDTFSSILIDDDNNPVRQVLSFIGAPLIALLIAVLVSFYVLGVRRGWSKEHLATVAESALKPVGMILLVVGAGGVFGSVLVASGVGDVLADSLTSTGLPLIVMAFVIALALRIAQGSATVAIVATSGIISGLVANGPSVPARPRPDLHRDRCRRDLHVPHQRRRLLAGQPLLRHQREGHAQVLDRAGNHHGLHRVRHCRRAEPGPLRGSHDH